MVGDGSSGIITPWAVSASMISVSKSLSSMAPVIGMTIRAETTRFDGDVVSAVIRGKRGEGHVYIAMRKVKAGAEICERVLYGIIIDQRERG
jgi:hypothetical protein